MRFSEFLSKYNEEKIFENIIFDRTNRVIRWAGVPRKELEKDRVHGTSPDTIFRIELKPLNYARFPGALYSSFRYRTADKGMSGENVAKTATDANVSNYQLDVLRALKGRNPRNHLFNFTFASNEDRTRIIEKCAQDLIMVIKTRNVKIVFGPDATPVANPAARNGLVQELIAVARRLNPTVMNGVVMLDSIFKKRIVQRDADGNFSDEVCSSFIARDRNTYQIALLWEVKQIEGYEKTNTLNDVPPAVLDAATKSLEGRLIDNIRSVLNRHAVGNNGFLKLTDMFNRDSMKIGNVFVPLDKETIDKTIILLESGNALIVDDSVSTGASLTDLYHSIVKHLQKFEPAATSKRRDIIAYVMFTAAPNSNKAKKDKDKDEDKDKDKDKNEDEDAGG